MHSQQSTDSRCLRTFSDGRQCRMLRKPGHLALCVFHAREEAQLLDSERLAQELSEDLASLSGNFNTGLDINHVLGKVFKALAQRKISARDANAFAYLAQLMLHSMNYVKNEIFWAHQDPDAYYRMIRQSIPSARDFMRPPAPAQQQPPTSASTASAPQQPASAATPNSASATSTPAPRTDPSIAPVPADTTATNSAHQPASPPATPAQPSPQPHHQPSPQPSPSTQPPSPQQPTTPPAATETSANPSDYPTITIGNSKFPNARLR